MRNFFLHNLIFQKIGIEVVIITFSEFLMLFYGSGFFNENYILRRRYVPRICCRFRVSKRPVCPLCHRAWGAQACLQPEWPLQGMQEAAYEAAWGQGRGDPQVKALGFCNLFPTACAYESYTSTLPHNSHVI